MAEPVRVLGLQPRFLPPPRGHAYGLPRVRGHLSGHLLGVRDVPTNDLKPEEGCLACNSPPRMGSQITGPPAGAWLVFWERREYSMCPPLRRCLSCNGTVREMSPLEARANRCGIRTEPSRRTSLRDAGRPGFTSKCGGLKS